MVEDAFCLINACEQRFPVHSWVIGEMHVWPLLRVNIFFRLLHAVTKDAQPAAAQRKGAFGRLSQVRSLISHSLEYGAAAWRDREHNASPDATDVVILGDNVSRVLINGVWYDRLCEPLIEVLAAKGIHCLHLEPNPVYRIPRNNESRFIYPALELVRLKSRMTHCDALPEGLEGYGEFLGYVTSRCPDITVPSPGDLVRLAQQTIFQADYYEAMLRRLGPSLAFVVEYYYGGMAFTLACNRLNIPVVEVPHGNHGVTHIAYSRWKNIPGSGFNTHPAIFWCWTAQEADCIGAWARGGALPVPVIGGNPWLERWLHGTDALVSRYDRRVAELKQRYPGERHILLTYEFDMESAARLIETAPASWRWWVRLHPCKLDSLPEVAQLFAQRGIGNIEIEQATSLPLYALLRQMDGHVTECSSVVIEADRFGVPSVVTTELGAGLFREQVATGSARVISDNAGVVARLCEAGRVTASGGADESRFRQALDQILAYAATDVADRVRFSWH